MEFYNKLFIYVATPMQRHSFIKCVKFQLNQLQSDEKIIRQENNFPNLSFIGGATESRQCFRGQNQGFNVVHPTFRNAFKADVFTKSNALQSNV